MLKMQLNNLILGYNVTYLTLERLLDGFREPRRRSCLFPITTSLLSS